MDGLLWAWAYVLAKVLQSDSTVRRLPASWAFASPPLVFYCIFLYLSGFVRCSKIFAALMRPLPDFVYWILAVPVGIGFVVGLSSDWYRGVFNNAMRKVVFVITVKEDVVL